MHDWELAHADKLPQAQVQRVTRGDMLLATRGLANIRIRLASVGCPADDHPWASCAQTCLTELIHGREIYLEQHGIDHQGYMIATIYVRTDTRLVNVNEHLVLLGHARVAREDFAHLSGIRRRKLNRLENHARNLRIGVWNASPARRC